MIIIPLGVLPNKFLHTNNELVVFNNEVIGSTPPPPESKLPLTPLLRPTRTVDWDKIPRGGGGGGTQIWFRRGCAAEAAKPILSLRVILAEKGTYY